MADRGRLRRVVTRTAEALALACVFSAASSVGFALHSDFTATRRLVKNVVTDRLAELFKGKIVVHDVRHLSVGTTTTVRADVEILDADGKRAIMAKGVDVALDLVELSRSLKSGGAPSLRFTKAKVDDLELVLDVDAQKQLKLAQAFATKHPKPPQPPKPAVEVPESIRLFAPALSVKHVHVHGDVAPPPGIDGDLDGLEAKVVIASNVLRVDPLATDVTLRTPKAPTQSGPVHGHLTGSVAIPLAGGEPKVVLDWKGDAAGVPFDAHVGLEGQRIDAKLDVAQVAPEVVTKAFAVAPVTKPVELHVTVGGSLASQLTVDAKARAGDGTITAKGAISLAGKMPFTLDADLDRVDAAAVTGPVSAITAHLHAEGVIDDGKPAGSFRLDSKEGSVAGNPIPVVEAEGTFDPRAVHAKIHAREGSLDVRSTVDVDVPSKKISFDATARASDLSTLKRAPGVATGSATAHATGTIDLEAETITGRVTVDGNDIGKGPAKIGRVHAEASIAGPLRAPAMNVTADATDVTLKAEGKDPLVYPTAKARARVSLSPSPRIALAEIRVDGSEPGTSIVASASEISLANGNVVVKGGKVTGLGTPLDVEAHALANGGISVRARAEGVDLHRARQMTGIKELELLPEGSRASIDIDVKTAPDRADGHVDLVVAAKDGSSAEVHAVLTGKHVSGRARVAKPEIGWVEIAHAEIDLPGAPSPKTFERATGSVDLRGEVDLASVGALFGGDSVREMKGIAALSARIERGNPSTMPFVAATVQTRGLEVLLENGTDAGLRIAGIDGAVHALYDGATDDAEVGLVTWDPHGVLASANVKSRVPVIGWVKGSTRLDRDMIGALPISGTIDVEERGVATLPLGLGKKDLRGTVSAHLDASGTVAHPLVMLAASADDLRLKREPRGAGGAGGPGGGPPGGTQFAPVDGALHARWDGENVVVTLALDEEERQRRERRERRDDEQGEGDGRPPPSEKKPGHVRALVLGRVRAEDLVQGRVPDWNASAELDVRDLELGPLPLPMNLRGALTTHASLRDLTSNPTLVVNAHVAQLGIMGARVASADIEADVKSDTIAAKAVLAQDDGGSAKVDIDSRAIRWKGLDFEYDGTRPARIAYAVDRMRLSILRPLVRRSIPEIDGLLNGRGSASVDATSQVFEGGLVLEKGRMYVNALGDEITDLKATATFERNGVFRIADVSGKVNSGVVNAAVAGRMRGLAFEAADIVINIPTKDGVPLSSEGATFAEANGEVKIAVRMAPDRKSLTADVVLSHARIEVPDRGTQNLQSLDPDETIAIGIRRRDGTLAPVLLRAPSARQQAADAGETPITARLSVTLGEEVTLEGRGLRLTLTGRTLVEVAREISVTGQINLKAGGTIDVQGRKFVVDRGIVTFGGKDPADPTVIAAAYWDAPDQTRIWVEFQGPLKTGKLSLRSEPPYSKNEILSILLFGRPDPSQTNGQSKANQVGGAAATAGLNKALGELSDDIDLEQDQTSANRLRTKLGYRIRRNLKVQLGYATGISQREPDTTYLFLEWQFAAKWSLLGTRGDRGTSILDMLWQHRY